MSKEKKTFLSVITLAVLCILLIPVRSFAADIDYPSKTGIFIGQTEIEAEKYYKISDDGTISEIPDSGEDNYNVYLTGDAVSPILTLKDAKIPGTIQVTSGSTIILSGNNTQGSEGDVVSTGIEVEGTTEKEMALHITGTGSLTQWVTTEGINCTTTDKKTLLIDGGVINIHNQQSAPIIGDGDVVIGGNAKIEAANDPNTTNTISALISRGDFYVKENATLTIDSNGGGISSDGKYSS